MLRKKVSCILFIASLLCIHTVSRAQTDPILEGSDIRPVTISGSVGLTASTYTASGTSNRRAPSLVKTTGNLDFSLFGLSSGLDFLYSTDQTGIRQNLNNFSFDATWEWLTLKAGDVNPNFSKYGLSSINIRGGYIGIEPGNWSLELTGGQSRKEIIPSSKQGFREPSFQRISVAGKLGYSSSSDKYIFLSSHYSIDRKGSLTGTQQVTPEENLTLSTDSKITFIDKLLSFATEVTASVYTRDTNASALPTGDGGIPSSLSSVFVPRRSSRINYAASGTAALNLDNANLELGYERIQPGFISLGLGRIRDDQQNISISPSVRLLDNDLSVQANVTLGRNNLFNNRIQTQKDKKVATNVQLRLSNTVSLNGGYNLLINDFTVNPIQTGNNSQTNLFDRKQVAHTITFQPSVALISGKKTHNISLTGSYFTLSNTFDGSGPSVPSEINTNTITSSLAYSLSFQSGLAVNASGNYLINKAMSTKNTSVGGSLGSSYSFFENQLTLSLNGNINQTSGERTSAGQNATFNTKARQMSVNFTGNYRLGSKDTFSVTVRSRNNNVIEGGQSTFSELEGSFNYRHSF